MQGKKKTVRSSNIEALRIVAMLAIVAHHFVVNSGLMEHYDYRNPTVNMYFLELWGMWGKTAINVFVLISGYFMCRQKWTWRRWFKLYFEVKFYEIIGYIVFILIGYEKLAVKELLMKIFSVVMNINNGFTSSFLAFYLLIPFLNILLDYLKKEQLLLLNGISITMFTISSTFLGNRFIYNDLGWYIALYFVAAYLRLYSPKWSENKKSMRVAMTISIVCSWISVIVLTMIRKNWGFEIDVYHFVANSQKALAFLVGVFVFLFFKNIDVKQSSVVNKIAGTTFGVLLIHANSDAMRNFLWRDLFHVADMYELTLLNLIAYSLIVVIIVFIMCSFIDYIRIVLLERPLLRVYDKHEAIFKEKMAYIGKRIIKVLDL